MTYPDLDPVGDIKPGISVIDIKRKETPAVSEGGKVLETNGTHDDFIEVVLDPCHKDTHPEISSEVNIGTEGPNEEYRRGNMHNTTFEGTVNNGILDDRVVGCGFMGHQDFGILFDKGTSEIIAVGHGLIGHPALRSLFDKGGLSRLVCRFQLDMALERIETMLEMDKIKAMIEEQLEHEQAMAEKEQEEHLTFLDLLAYLLLFCTVLIKSLLQKQSLVKYSFSKAVMLLLWTSGDVEKHPGPPLNDMKTVRELYTRLVKISQDNTVVDWSTAPANWDQNVVSFKDINNKKESSDNEEKYALFYEALCTVIKNRGCVPSWCVEEMTFVETGNAVELQKCQTARKVRELLEQHHPSDHEDILRRAGYPRQGENISAPEVNRSTGQPASAAKRQQQRPKKCPFNLPEFKPIAKITDTDTARKIAIGCMRQSKKEGKYQNGSPHQQTATKRPASTKPVAPKRRRVSPTVTNTGRSTSTVIKPNISSTLPSVVPAAGCSASTIALPTIPILYTLTTFTSNVGSDSSACQTPKGSSEISTGAKVSTAHNNLPPNHSEQSSNDVSRGTPDTSTSKRQQPCPSGQQPNNDVRGVPGSTAPNRQQQSSSNLITLPSEDLDDLGFSSDVDFDKFLTQILKDSKI